MCFNLFKKQPTSQPTTLHWTALLDIYTVSSILIDTFPNIPIYLSDMTYYTCNILEVVRILKLDDTDKIIYESEKFDCDDYAYSLMGFISRDKNYTLLPFGIVWTTNHALNIFIDEYNQVWLIEPQTDIVYTLEDYIHNVNPSLELRFIIM